MPTSVLMVIAAVNEALIYVLNSIDNRVDLSSDIFIMAIGAVPFLATALLLALAIVWSARPPRQLASAVLIVGGVGLPFMVVGGLWAGLAATFFAQPGSRVATALATYQFTFAAAVLADIVTLVVALVTLVLAARARPSSVATQPRLPPPPHRADEQLADHQPTDPDGEAGGPGWGATGESDPSLH